MVTMREERVRAFRWKAACGVVGLAFLLSGCRTYDQQVDALRSAYRLGDYARAADSAVERVEAARGGRDELIWSLEEATLLRSAGRWDESARAFERADQLYEDYARQARLKVASEGLALVTNPAKLPYRGRAYDGIMVCVYQALAALQKGDRDAARVYINRAYERQQEAVADHAAKIEKERAQSAGNADAERTMKDPAFASATAGLEPALQGLSAYADYVNPFAVYLDGLYHWRAGVDASDRQRAQKCFERVLAFAPDNPYVRDDWRRMTQAKAEPEGPVCYVVFETGMAPSREAVRIDVPIIISRVSYVGISFPRLKTNDAFLRGLTVEGGGLRERTLRIASLDAVVATDFKNELPSIITHATASAVAKAAAAYAINQAAEQSGNDVAKWSARVATAAYQVVMNVADTRTWTTLPKEIQVCKLPVPADRRIVLSAPEYGWRQDVTLNEGAVIVLWVKTVDQPNRMAMTQFALK